MYIQCVSHVDYCKHFMNVEKSCLSQLPRKDKKPKQCNYIEGTTGIQTTTAVYVQSIPLTRSVQTTTHPQVYVRTNYHSPTVYVQSTTHQQYTNYHSPAVYKLPLTSSVQSSTHQQCTNYHSPAVYNLPLTSSVQTTTHQQCTNYHSPTVYKLPLTSSAQSTTHQQCTILHSPAVYNPPLTSSVQTTTHQQCTNYHSPAVYKLPLTSSDVQLALLFLEHGLLHTIQFISHLRSTGFGSSCNFCPLIFSNKTKHTTKQSPRIAYDNMVTLIRIQDTH